MTRDDLGAKEFTNRNEYYRDTGRLLSDFRDASAVIESLDKLEVQYKDAVYESIFKEVRRALEARRDELIPDAGRKSALFKQVKKRIKMGIELVNPTDQVFSGWEGTVNSLKRTYSRAYSLHRKLKKDPSPENVHQWRKRTKYLRYELRLLKRVWPQLFNPWRKELHRLSDFQGDHHDLHELKKILADLKGVSKETKKALFALANQHQEQCYLEAMALGSRLYVEKSKPFARRMAGYLESWGEQPKRANAKLAATAF